MYLLGEAPNYPAISIVKRKSTKPPIFFLREGIQNAPMLSLCCHDIVIL